MDLVEQHIKALGHEYEETRKAAARALGETGDLRALGPLTQSLHDPCEDVRWEAATSLGKMGNTRTVKPLTRALVDGDKFVRRAAAAALGRIGDSGALVALARAAEDDEDEDVRNEAKDALKRIRRQGNQATAKSL